MKQLIKSKIKKGGSLGDFADKHGIRRSSLYDFLNGKKDLTLQTFLKIATPLGIEIGEKVPNVLKRVEEIKEKELKVGMMYDGGSVLALFVGEDTGHQFILTEKNNELILAPC